LLPQCDVTPTSVDFGNVPVGEFRDTTLVVTNAGGGSLTGTMSAIGSYYTIVGDSSYSLPAGQSDTVTVRFSPLASGVHVGTVETGNDLCGDVSCTGTGGDWADVTQGPLADTEDSRGLAWGDADADGDPDLYILNTGVGGWNRFFRNDAGIFVDATSGPEGAFDGQGVSWGDFDNDGDLDLYVARFHAGNKLFLNLGTGTFLDTTTAPLDDAAAGRGTVWGDYDRDGKLDLYLFNQDTANRLFRNEGDASFSDVTAGPLGDTGGGRSVAWADFDNDGDLDLFVATNASKLLRNDGEAGFVDVTSGPLVTIAKALAWGDYDNDEDLDLYVTNLGSTTGKLFRNDGGGNFTDVTTGPLVGMDGMSAAWGDYDNDADLDLYVGNTTGQPNQLFRNDGGGTFIDVTSSPLDDAGYAFGVAWADYDEDGDLDIGVANLGGSNRLFRNNQTTGNHWLHIDLRGTVSNACAIGARVRLVAGGVTQIREVSGGRGNAQNSLTVGFGLGAAATVDTIEVLWPSGIVQDTTLATVDRRITLVEPKSQTGVREPFEPGASARTGRMSVYPNPFSRSTVIRYELAENLPVDLEVYDLRGRRVRILVSESEKPPGRYDVVWDGLDGSGKRAASGIYFYRLRVGTVDRARKIVLMR